MDKGLSVIELYKGETQFSQCFCETRVVGYIREFSRHRHGGEGLRVIFVGYACACWAKNSSRCLTRKLR
jgi:hypothetical protein